MVAGLCRVAFWKRGVRIGAPLGDVKCNRIELLLADSPITVTWCGSPPNLLM